jgi:hypothetical protein
MLLFVPLFISAQTSEKSVGIASIEEDVNQTVVKVPGVTVIVNHYGDTVTQVYMGNRRIEVIENHKGTTKLRMVHSPRQKFKGHWAGFSLGFNNFGSTYFSTELPDNYDYLDLYTGKSIEVCINLLQKSIPLSKNNNFGLVTGVGLTLNNFRFNSYERITRDEFGNLGKIDTERAVEKNKLLLRYITAPLLFEFQIPDQNKYKFYVNAGIYGSFKFSSHVKVKYGDNAGPRKIKYREDLNINPFKYGAMVRTGYRWLNLYATCDLSRLFQKNQGPELYPWSIGIMLVCF